MYLCIGKIVNTHGIKGELRLLSKFELKEKVFKKNMQIYIGRDKEKQVISTYRKHKCFDMITLDGFDNINQVLKYKGALVYVLKEDIIFSDNEYLDEDLIGIDVYSNENLIGKVTKVDIITDKNKVLIFNNGSKDVMVPFVTQFVTVDIKSKKVIVNLIEGMM